MIMSRSSERFLRTRKASVEEYDDTGEYKTGTSRSFRRPVEHPNLAGRKIKNPLDAILFDNEFTSGD
jgi:hypothetical protein